MSNESLADRLRRYQQDHAKKCGQIDYGPCQYCRDMNKAAAALRSMEQERDELKRKNTMLGMELRSAVALKAGEAGDRMRLRIADLEQERDEANTEISKLEVLLAARPRQSTVDALRQERDELKAENKKLHNDWVDQLGRNRR